MQLLKMAGSRTALLSIFLVSAGNTEHALAWASRQYTPNSRGTTTGSNVAPFARPEMPEESSQAALSFSFVSKAALAAFTAASIGFSVTVGPAFAEEEQATMTPSTTESVSVIVAPSFDAEGKMDSHDSTVAAAVKDDFSSQEVTESSSVAKETKLLAEVTSNESTATTTSNEEATTPAKIEQEKKEEPVLVVKETVTKEVEVVPVVGEEAPLAPPAVKEAIVVAEVKVESVTEEVKLESKIDASNSQSESPVLVAKTESKTDVITLQPDSEDKSEVQTEAKPEEVDSQPESPVLVVRRESATDVTAVEQDSHDKPEVKTVSAAEKIKSQEQKQSEVVSKDKPEPVLAKNLPVEKEDSQDEPDPKLAKAMAKLTKAIAQNKPLQITVEYMEMEAEDTKLESKVGSDSFGA